MAPMHNPPSEWPLTFERRSVRGGGMSSSGWRSASFLAGVEGTHIPNLKDISGPAEAALAASPSGILPSKLTCCIRQVSGQSEGEGRTGEGIVSTSMVTTRPSRASSCVRIGVSLSSVVGPWPANYC